MKIITHDGTMHPDEVMACAILLLVYPDASITRTRNIEDIAAADVVVDVGNIHNASKLRFDHHQPGGAGTRDNGIPYSACGLVWQRFGSQICDNDTELLESIDSLVIQPIDAADNSIRVYDSPYRLKVLDFATMVKQMRPTWGELRNDPTMPDRVFTDLVNLGKLILQRITTKHNDLKESSPDILAAYNSAPDKRYIVCDFPISKHAFWSLRDQMPELLMCVSNVDDEYAYILVMKDARGNFKFEMPQSWRSLRGAELEKVSGIPGVEFCHAAGFFVNCKTKESAIAVVRKVLQ